jgi:small subunit ribosomal protein S20
LTWPCCFCISSFLLGFEQKGFKIPQAEPTPDTGSGIIRKEQINVANHKSALKRANQNTTRRLRNKAVKTRVKNVVKDVRLAAGEQPAEQVATTLNTAKSVIDTAAKKGVIHPNTAARKISRLAKLANSAPAK